MKSQKPFAQAHQRLLTTLDPNAGWLLLQLQLATCYPHRHATNGASIKLSYAEMASLARISKASVRGLLERLVSGGWIEFEEGGGRAKSTIRCLLQPEHQPSSAVQPQASTSSSALNINNLPVGSVASSNNSAVYQMVVARSAAATPVLKQAGLDLDSDPALLASLAQGYAALPRKRGHLARSCSRHQQRLASISGSPASVRSTLTLSRWAGW